VSGPSRVRLQLDEDGSPHAQPTPSHRRMRHCMDLCGVSIRLQSGDTLLRHKTSWRERMTRIVPPRTGRDGDEVIYLNERNEIVEGSSTMFSSG